jgi:hypothetical protein
VLLHVVTAAGYIDFAMDARAGLEVLQQRVFYRSFQVVDYVAVFSVGYLGYAEFVVVVGYGDVAGVVDLAAAGGIEGSAVENYGWARSFEDFSYFCFEVVEKGIGVVEAVGHLIQDM